MSHHDIFPLVSTSFNDALSTTDASLDFQRSDASYLPLAPPHPETRNRKRRLSRAKAGQPLSRSFSTPTLQGHLMPDSDLDKKRNKLGYQRISIACAHCRRRKIRCLIAENDREQRCQNCIRLKKECVFYPVDQQSAMEAKSETSSKTGAPSAASPAMSGSPSQPNLGDAHEHPRYPQDPTGEGGSTYLGIPFSPDMTNIASQGAPVLWGHGHDFHAQNLAMTSSGNQQNIPADFAPFPGTREATYSAVQPSHPYETFHEQDSPSWHPSFQSNRSMSYPNIGSQPYGTPMSTDISHPAIYQQSPGSMHRVGSGYARLTPGASPLVPQPGSFFRARLSGRPTLPCICSSILLRLTQQLGTKARPAPLCHPVTLIEAPTLGGLRIPDRKLYRLCARQEVIQGTSRCVSAAVLEGRDQPRTPARLWHVEIATLLRDSV
ncbi:hypothetical protein MRB53_038361 [Persea americana]|nr:hypothetical protein MRB53_038361 [Persea americana]